MGKTEPSSTSTSEISGRHLADPPRAKKKRKTGSKTKSQVSQHKDNLFLESRMQRVSIRTPWPDWIKLGSSLLFQDETKKSNRKIMPASRCRQWSDENCPADSVADTTREEGIGRCRNCHLSPLHHRLNVMLAGRNTRDAKSLSLQIFAMVRDVRCCCVISLDKDEKQKSRAHNNDKSPREYARSARRIARRILTLFSSFRSALPLGEAELMERKCSMLKKSSEDWCILEKSAPLASDSPSQGRESSCFASFQAIVKLVIACDSLYFRLYYLEVSGAILLPNDVTEHNSSSRSVSNIPRVLHPTFYFGLENFCWNIEDGKEYFTKFLEEVLAFNEGDETKKENPALQSILKRYGLNCAEMTTAHHLGDRTSTSSARSMHVLADLHYGRMMETVLIFCKTGWSQSSDTVQELVAAINTVQMKAGTTEDAFYAQHDTPAPSILAAWRDSSRDSLCNLYAYATLSPETVLRFQEFAKQHSIKGMLELGAGTGYVSQLLKNNGLDVFALDITPTSSARKGVVNEYHGSTPPFCKIEEGSSATLDDCIQNQRVNITQTALVLCYPPPLSTMAFDALKVYLRAGGKYVIHIGEFFGLTGSPEFGNLLIDKFRCIDRFPCLEWGTDAAETTFWVKRDGLLASIGTIETPDVLLPCSNCLSKPAIGRCRFARSLAYCSNVCITQHKQAMEVHLAMNMVQGSAHLELDIANSHQFTLFKRNESSSSNQCTDKTRKKHYKV
eukprot:scaffold10680_cov64-Attheya_sp.AAC.2